MRFLDTALRLLGATSGEQIIKTAAAASGAITLPAGTTDFSATGPGVVKQVSAGAAFTVASVTVAEVTGAAPLASPSFTGDPQAPTPATADNDTSIATTAFVKAQAYLTASGISGMTAGQIPIAATAATITSSGNLSGAVTTSGSLATTLANNAVATAHITNANVTYAKIQNVANNRLLGNTSGSAAAPSEIVLPLSVANGGTGDTGTAWTTYTPTLTAGTGTFTTATASSRYKLLGKTCFFEAQVNITTNGTAAGSVILTLPGGITAASYSTVVGREVAIGGWATVGSILAGTQLLITKYDNTYPGGTGATIAVSGVFETT